MHDLNTRGAKKNEHVGSIFETVLAQDFAKLPPQIRATHTTAERSHWIGKARVTRGTGIISNIVGACFRFPRSNDDYTVKVTKIVTQSGETWLRDFGGNTFKSYLRPTPQGMTERFGWFTFLLGLRVTNDALEIPVISGRFGPLPMPRWLLPISDAREFVQNGLFHFDVRLYAPITKQLLVRYQGYLEPDDALSHSAPNRAVVAAKPGASACGSGASM